MKNTNKTILFVDNEKILNKIKITKDLTIITKGIVTKKYEKIKNIKHYSDFIEKYKNPNYFSTIYWLQKWAEKKIINGKSIKEILSYKNFTLWYFIEYPLFYYHLKEPFETRYPSVSRVTYYLNIIKTIFDRYSPTKIIIQNDKDLFYKLIIDFCKKKNVKIENLNIVEREKLLDKIKTNKIVIKIYLKSRILIRKILRHFLGKNFDRVDIIILSNERFCRDKEEDNLYCGSLINKLKENKISYKLVEYDQLYKLESIIKLLKHIKKNNSTFIGQYYNKEVSKESKKIVKLMQNRWDFLRNNKNFINFLEYRGINIYHYIKERFDFIFNVLSYYIADIIALSNQIIKKENPKVVIIEHDENYFGKGILVNTKNTKTKVISLQTELLYPSGCVARHIKSKKVLDKNKISWRPLADIKCVPGNYGKKVLINFCNYPSNVIKITGDPKYDRIVPKLKNIGKIQKERFNVKNNEKLIVFASGGVLQDSEIIPALIRAVDELSGCKLIIKAHPLADIKLLNKIVNSTKSKNVKVLVDTNLAELLSACDLFISVHSTVVIDAMVLEKPIMLINIVKCPMPYVELGGAYAVYKIEDIKDGIIKGLYDNNLKKKLTRGRKRFLKEYLYKLDGKASDRILNIIKSLL